MIMTEPTKKLVLDTGTDALVWKNDRDAPEINTTIRYVHKAHSILANLIPSADRSLRVKLEVARDNLSIALSRLQKMR